MPQQAQHAPPGGARRPGSKSWPAPAEWGCRHPSPHPTRSSCCPMKRSAPPQPPACGQWAHVAGVSPNCCPTKHPALRRPPACIGRGRVSQGTAARRPAAAAHTAGLSACCCHAGASRPTNKCAALHPVHMGADSTKGTWRMPGGPDRCSAPAGTPVSTGRYHAGSCMGREKAGRPQVADSWQGVASAAQ